GVGENKNRGELECRFTAGNEILLVNGEGRELARMKLPLPDADEGAQGLELSVEDNWLWLGSGGAPFFSQRLESPLRGRRLRIEGFDGEVLAECHAVIHGVLDCMFTRAPTDWVRNGGTWQVINRFACDPRWSHMNGQAPEGMGALWTKERYRGDFSVELYAGMRHAGKGTEFQWYHRLGDINLSVMGDTPSTARGYSVTCSGWDENHSQRYTTLYRNGIPVARSEAYTLPRWREGNKRKWLDPLLRGGRDVHGAWYFIKFRRIGSRLEYYFDNHLILSYEDPEPLEGGPVGIWTYRNSMMVARVKIAAQEFAPESRNPPSAEPLSSSAFRPELLLDDQPLLMRPDPWEIEDEVSYSRITWGGNGEASFRVQNELGGGAMYARSLAPPLAPGNVAGWSFFTRRSRQCLYNFHYSLVTREKQGFRTSERFFHHLSGSEDSRGGLLMTGRTAVPAGEAGTWTRVDAWIPPEVLMRAKAKGGLLRLDGFGILQAGYAEEGLLGNLPGDAYEVRGLVPIRTRLPRLASCPAGVTVSAPGIECEPLPEVASGNLQRYRLSPRAQEGSLLECELLLEAGNQSHRDRLVWIGNTETRSLNLSWSGEAPLALDLASGDALPLPAVEKAQIGKGRTASLLWLTPERLRIELPPDFAGECDSKGSFTLTLFIQGGAERILEIALGERKLADEPVLTGLSGP
ncbi:MAG: hypothetical protein HQL31_13975, partial [Planctomycetes bacterium]|nr:hypothetical protein [Planctomycetota bacterium]